MKLVSAVVSVLAVSCVLGGACRCQAAEPPAPSAEDLGFFESKIRPLLAEHCYECHSAQAKNLQGGLRLDLASGVRAGGDSGAAVVPGKPDESLLIEAVRYGSDQLQMPPDGKLPDADIELLKDWVARGAPYPDDGQQAQSRKRSIDFAAGRSFWSFQPLAAVPPPGHDPRATERRIDAFILAELEAHRLSPSPAADRRTLIRRACFDLTGLAPSPEEVEAFVNDESPDAYARLVERLLASPHYGERWGRFWLDLVRYCDIPEAWVESGAQAWLYRDWVVRALNADLPYNQFIVRQLAADQSPDATPADIPALGFLGLSPVYWKELKLDHNVIKAVVAEEWEERINTLSSSLLGLTVSCARCHDHKFDPISTEDYYALAGVFSSIRQAPRPMLPEPEALAVSDAVERVKELEEQVKKLQAQTPATDEAKQQIATTQAEIEKIKQATPHYDSLLAYAVVDASLHVLPDGPDHTKLEYKPEAQDVAIQVRGNPTRTTTVVPRRFLTVLSPEPPPVFHQGSGRLELAKAIVGEGGPLAARVIVNRIWKQHFGRGLVETTSNFGVQGLRPTHPALLEDLAARFVQSGWSWKWLHREIMLSATYRQSSARHAAHDEIDPDNRYLWRMNRRRLEVEAWRDAMLSAGGALERSLGGPSVDLGLAENHRRTLYATVKRRDLNDLLRLYDFPDPTAHSPGREPTTTPLQQLFVLNSDFVSAQAAALAARVRAEAPGFVEGQVRRAYQLLYGRDPTASELQIAGEFLGASAAAPPGDELWREYAQALLGSNELMFVD